MNRRPVRSLLLLASLFAGCSGGSEAPATPSATTRETPAPAAATAAATETEAAPAPSLPEAEVRALLDRWLDAQNRGDFAQYEPLFAERFTGVRRTRNQVRRFDHDGWIADRRRMFERPMQVVVRDVVIRTTPANAEVTFTQVWSSGRYSDEGRKRLLVVREDAGLRIGIEEMLETRMTDDLEPRIAAGHFLVIDGPTRYVVLGSTRSSGTGAYRHQTEGGRYYARRAPDATLAQRLGPLQGRAMKLLGDGGSCAATLGEPTLLRVVTPHFGTVAMWNGQGDGDEEQAGPALAPARVAQEAWSLGDTTLVVAPVVGACEGAVATFADGPAPVALAQGQLAAAQRSAVLAAFDRNHSVDAEALAEDDEAPGPHAVDTRQLPDGALLVTVRRQLPGECGGENAFETYRVQGTTVTALELDAPVSLAFAIDGVVQLVTTGDMEGSRSLYRLREGAEKVTEAAFAFLDCPC